jgi:8-oxo-dGTP diphosphatase
LITSPFGGILIQNKVISSKHPIIGVGVVILRNYTVLLGRRKGPRKPGLYGLPGGFLETTESVEMCAKREVLEETGLSDIDLIPVSTVRWNDDDNYYFDFIFYANCPTGNPVVKETDRVESWDWWDLDHPPKPLYEPTEIALQPFRSDRKILTLKLFLRKLLFRNLGVIWIKDNPDNTS